MLSWTRWTTFWAVGSFELLPTSLRVMLPAPELVLNARLAKRRYLALAM